MSHVCFVVKEWNNTIDRSWVDRGLFAIKLELNVTITLRRPRSAELRI